MPTEPYMLRSSKCFYLALISFFLSPLIYLFGGTIFSFPLLLFFLLGASYNFLKCPSGKKKALSLFTLGISLYLYFSVGGGTAMLISYWMFLLCFFMTYVPAESSLAGPKYFPYLFASLFSLFILNASFDASYWNPDLLLPQIPFFFFFLVLLSFFLSFKPAFFLFVLVLIFFRAAAFIFLHQRLTYLSLSDLTAAPAVFRFMGSYLKTPGGFDFVIIFFSIVFILIFCFSRWEFPCRPGLKIFLISVPLFLLFFLLTGEAAMLKLSKEDTDKKLYLDLFSGFAASSADSLSIAFTKVDPENEAGKLEGYVSDKEPLDVNIVMVLCESFADAAGAFEVTPNRDPLRAFYALEEKGARTGKIKTASIGGGTANAEWEFLTGLPLKLYSSMRIPFMYDVKKNYAFTSSSLYDRYFLHFMHPNGEIDYKREPVYKVFEYDRLDFEDSVIFSKTDNIIRDLIMDCQIYENVLADIKEHEEPVVDMCVTIQGHSGYLNLDLEGKIEIEEQREDKDALESYLTLMESSSEQIAEFINDVEELDEPVLVIFFGDHFPGGFGAGSEEACYYTPYMVYSNFCDLGEMPEVTTFDKLFVQAKEAAGLPMSGYEKFVLEENGEIDKGFILARIRYGAFASDE